MQQMKQNKTEINIRFSNVESLVTWTRTRFMAFCRQNWIPAGLKQKGWRGNRDNKYLLDEGELHCVACLPSVEIKHTSGSSQDYPGNFSNFL